jgi:DNA-binding response OmpR family regulator
MRVLTCAADSARLRTAVDALEGAGATVTQYDDVASAEHAVRTHRADVLIYDPSTVDAGFPSRVRRIESSLARIALVGARDTATLVEALDAGARDVLNGGMSAEEILARVRAATRIGQHVGRERISIGSLVIDDSMSAVSWNGAQVVCADREYAVLSVLARRFPQSVAREQIYREAWGYAMVRGDRVVDVTVKRLRDRLASAGAPADLVTTVPGIGYALAAAPAARKEHA